MHTHTQHTHNTCTHTRAHIHVCPRIHDKHHTGKDDSVRPDTSIGLGHAVVVKLVEALEGKGYHVYTDNFYTSPALYSDLLLKGFGACGTCNINRCGLPTEIKRDIQKGEVMALHFNGMMALKWRDRRTVLVQYDP